MDLSLTHKMRSDRSTGFSSWSSTLSSGLKMLIVPSLLFAISFLTQVAVLAAPLSLDGVSINPRGFHDGPAGHPSHESAGRAGSGMFALIISQHFHLTLKLTVSPEDTKPKCMLIG